MVSCTLTCPTAGDVQVAVDRHEDQLHHGRQDGRIDGKTGSGAGDGIPTQATPMPGIRETAVQIRKADRALLCPYDRIKRSFAPSGSSFCCFGQDKIPAAIQLNGRSFCIFYFRSCSNANPINRSV